MLRHQHYLSERLSLKPGMQVLDVGCGVGGPMGNLARHSGAGFVGINNNAYQIERAKLHTRDVESLCRFIHADYMRIPEPGPGSTSGTSIAIDPRLFRLFGIERVPAVVVVPGGVPPCESRGCSDDPAPPHDLVAGNIGLVAALETVAAEGDAGRAVARRHLERLMENGR